MSEPLPSLPTHVLAFDPGGTDHSWAYCLSTIKDGEYTPVQSGFVPVFSELSNIDLSKHLQFRDFLIESYGESIHLVAERFIGRGFTAKISEYIPYSLGVWTAIWKAPFKLVMASQWKKPFKRFNAKYPTHKYENWWEHHFEYLATEEHKKKRVIHIQDAACIGLFYYRKILGVQCSLPNLKF